AGKKSGFRECWSSQRGWSYKEFSKPMIWNIWNLHYMKGPKWFEQEKYFLENRSEGDLGIKEEAGKISPSQRQWIQVEKLQNIDTSPYILKEELKQEMKKWKFPLNFIDFETSATALPFNKGRRPYEQVAFQFSHHTVTEQGDVKHENEYINFESGIFPNFEFVRELKKALSTNSGSIFMYAPHENTILNAIYRQLTDS